MKALGIGQLVLDKTVLLNTYPEEGLKIVPMKMENSVGGPVASALILLAKLGVETHLLASVGNDEAGEILKKKLMSYGVKLIPVLTKRTKVHTVIVNSSNGSRTIIKSTNSGQAINTVPQELIDTADVIIFDRHEEKAFDYVMAHKRAETKVVIDPSDEVSAKTIKMIQSCEYPILPIEALQKFRRHEDLEANIQSVFEIVKKPFIITAGGFGSVLCDGKNMKLFPSYDLRVVDTLGAGDVYRGAFAYGILQNWDIEKTIDYANLVAGLQCTKLGNSSAIPQPEEIEQVSKSASRNNFNLNYVLQQV